MKIFSSIKNFLAKHLSSPTFYCDGDWLIWRCTSPLGEFRMDLCATIILKENRKLSTDDIERILARYKEHVSFWNIPLYEGIMNDLKIFAQGVKMDKGFIYDMFNELEPKRVPMKQKA